MLIISRIWRVVGAARRQTGHAMVAVKAASFAGATQCFCPRRTALQVAGSTWCVWDVLVTRVERWYGSGSVDAVDVSMVNETVM